MLVERGHQDGWLRVRTPQCTDGWIQGRRARFFIRFQRIQETSITNPAPSTIQRAREYLTALWTTRFPCFSSSAPVRSAAQGLLLGTGASAGKGSHCVHDRGADSDGRVLDRGSQTLPKRTKSGNSWASLADRVASDASFRRRHCDSTTTNDGWICVFFSVTSASCAQLDRRSSPPLLSRPRLPSKSHSFLSFPLGFVCGCSSPVPSGSRPERGIITEESFQRTGLCFLAFRHVPPPAGPLDPISPQRWIQHAAVDDHQRCPLTAQPLSCPCCNRLAIPMRTN